MAPLLIMQHCPVDSISVAGFQQSQMISASDGKEKQICCIKKKNNMGQHVVAAMAQCTKKHSGVQGLAQGPAAVTMVGISGDHTQICRYGNWNEHPFLSDL